MADSAPSKNDIQLVFKKLRSIPTNKVCFDCSAKNPTWSSVTYGVFICIDCSAVHRSLGVHLTFVRSTQLDTNWTWLQLRQMQIGGNANADSFFRQHNCITTDAQQKYNSRAAQLYREKLHTAAVHAMRLHGTKLDVGIRADGNAKTPTSLHLESSADTHTTEIKKDVDFFEEHTVTEEYEVNQNNHVQNINSLSANGSVNLSGSNASIVAELAAAGKGPSVNVLLNSSETVNNERKPTIGIRKPAAKRTGLGSKKAGGLGAQRVKANFADIEREAELADQLRTQESVNTPQPEKTPEEQEAQMTSMRLAYEDLSIQQKKKEEKLKAVDPRKAEQIERLGMGIGNRSGISHSALNDMKTIEQEIPVKPTTNSSRPILFDEDFDSGCNDFFECASSTTSGFSMYKGSRMSTETSSIDTMFFDPVRDHLNCPTDIGSKISSIGSSKQRWLDSDKSTGSKFKSDWGEPERRQPTSVTGSADKKIQPVLSNSNEAQKKFGSAKAISSDQYFSDSKDTDWERKTNLARFEGSSSISSADYFGRNEPGSGTTGYASSIQTPDLEDVKESVRQGVTKVAGKLSSLANGVMSSIQERYGGY